jgi:hypothetical protein
MVEWNVCCDEARLADRLAAATATVDVTRPTLKRNLNRWSELEHCSSFAMSSR